MYYFRYIIMIILLIALYIIIKRAGQKSKEDMSIKIFILIFLIYFGILFAKFGFTPMVLLNPMGLLLMSAVVMLLFFKISKKVRNLSYKIDAYNDIQTLYRDIDIQYNPSIASYIMYGRIEEKDIAADIMNLYAQRLIDVKKEEINGKTRYNLILNEDKYKNSKIFESDKYIIDTIIQKKRKFKFDSWNKKVENIFLNMGVCKEEKPKLTFKAIGLTMLIIFLISIIPMKIYFKENFYAILFALIVAFISIIPIVLFSSFIESKAVTKIRLNEIGREEAKKWIKFEKFIKAYTLLPEKKMEDIIIYEKYIPYSVALKINLNYKDTIYSAFNEKDIKEVLKDIDDEGILKNYF